MREHFPGYYRPTDAELRELFATCIFAFDANVLLNLYRYSQVTETALLQALGKLGDRVWLPHQAGLDFQKNKAAVIHEQKRHMKISLRKFEN